MFIPAEQFTDEEMGEQLEGLKHHIDDLFRLEVRDARFCFAKVEQFKLEIDIEGDPLHCSVDTHTFETVADVLRTLSGCMIFGNKKPCLYFNGRKRALNPKRHLYYYNVRSSTTMLLKFVTLSEYISQSEDDCYEDCNAWGQPLC